MADDDHRTVPALDGRHLARGAADRRRRSLFFPRRPPGGRDGRDQGDSPGRDRDRPHASRGSKAPTCAMSWRPASAPTDRAWWSPPMTARPCMSGTCVPSADSSPRMGLDWDAPAYSDDDPADRSAPPLPPLQVDLGPLPLTASVDPESLRARDRRPGSRAGEQTGPARQSRKTGSTLQRVRMEAGQRDRIESQPRARLTLARRCRRAGTEPGHVPQHAGRRPVSRGPIRRGHRDPGPEPGRRPGAYDGYDLFFQAMAHWQLGHKPQSLACFDKAVEWMEKNPQADEELIRFRAEAAALLGLEAEEALAPGPGHCISDRGRETHSSARTRCARGPSTERSRSTTGMVFSLSRWPDRPAARLVTAQSTIARISRKADRVLRWVASGRQGRREAVPSSRRKCVAGSPAGWIGGFNGSLGLRTSSQERPNRVDQSQERRGHYATRLLTSDLSVRCRRSGCDGTWPVTHLHEFRGHEFRGPVVLEDGHPGVGAIQDVVDQAAVVRSFRSSHRGKATE